MTPLYSSDIAPTNSLLVLCRIFLIHSSLSHCKCTISVLLWLSAVLHVCWRNGLFNKVKSFIKTCSLESSGGIQRWDSFLEENESGINNGHSTCQIRVRQPLHICATSRSTMALERRRAYFIRGNTNHINKRERRGKNTRSQQRWNIICLFDIIYPPQKESIWSTGTKWRQSGKGDNIETDILRYLRVTYHMHNNSLPVSFNILCNDMHACQKYDSPNSSEAKRASSLLLVL